MGSDLPFEVLSSIQRGHLAYSYRGRPALKCPFDIALYALLLWDIKPRTIIEVGSYGGGSALWLADHLRSYGIDGHVYSIDLLPPSDLQDPMISFMEGDAEHLDAVLGDVFFDAIPRPLLVIEDSSHMRRTSLAVMQYMHRFMATGEMMIIEDGIVSDLGMASEFDGGPARAVDEFLAFNGAQWQVDRKYCDFFGFNFTWNLNGYLRKIS
jgi:cephalosporin hydroxylase